MASANDSFIEKEVVLTIRVPDDFDREDKRMLDDEFSSILEHQGWELVSSREYRSTNEPVTTVPAPALPKGWCWHHEMDGSGALRAPDGKAFFSYDCAPYHKQNGIEYKETVDSSWDVFWGSFNDFIAHAENHISQTILRTSLMLGEHDIPGIMQSLAGRAWQGDGQNTVQIRAGDHIIKLEGYTYEPSYEYFSATASISMDDQVLYGLDSENVGAYQNKVVNIGIYEKLEDAIAHIKEHTNGHDYILLNDREQPRPKLDQLLSDAQTRSSVAQPRQNSPLHKSREH